MFQSEIESVNFDELSDREIIEATYASQLRVEMLVTETIKNLGPTIEAFSKGGLMGLFGGRR